MGNERSTLPWAKLLAPRLLGPSGLLSVEGEMVLVEGLATPSSLENPMDRGAWWAIVHRVAQSQTFLKQFSKHAHIETCLQDVIPSSAHLPETDLILEKVDAKALHFFCAFRNLSTLPARLTVQHLIWHLMYRFSSKKDSVSFSF